MNVLNFIEKFRIDLNEHCISNLIDTPSHYLAIGSINGKYGIIDDNCTEYLPFEYDNISLLSFNILQLSQNGKVGIVHINSDKIVKIIACEYDYIYSQSFDNVILLQRYTMNKQITDIYFTATQEIITNITDYYFLIANSNLITFSKDGKSHLYDYVTGCKIYETDMFCIDAYIQLDSTIVQYITKNDEICLLRISETQTQEFIFKGKSVIALYCPDEDFSFAEGFIIETSTGFLVLNYDCSILTEKEYKDIDIKTVLTLDSLSDTPKTLEICDTAYEINI